MARKLVKRFNSFNQSSGHALRAKKRVEISLGPERFKNSFRKIKAAFSQCLNRALKFGHSTDPNLSAGEVSGLLEQEIPGTFPGLRYGGDSRQFAPERFLGVYTDYSRA